MTLDNDAALGLLLLGGGVGAVGALGALAWRLRRTPGSMPTSAPPGPTTSPAPNSLAAATWVHPVPTINGRPAVVSSPFRAHDAANGTAKQHLGVDLMYRRADARDLIAAFPVGTAGGTAQFFMPEAMPVLAAADGVVAFAASTGVGNTVIVGHGNGSATYYTHLATLTARVGSWVRAGDPIGTIGASPRDPERLRHLHFELWLGGRRTGAIDPAPHLATWARRTIAWSPSAASPTLPTTPTSATTASASPAIARNGSLSPYRSVGAPGEPYPNWVRDLRGASGVYVIREIDGPIVYVGSSVGKLYATLTRHLQQWRRYKGYWRGQFAEGADPGLTYRRGAVEVAIKLTSPDDAHDEELRAIRRLHPRDNQLGQPELEAAPF